MPARHAHLKVLLPALLLAWCASAAVQLGVDARMASYREATPADWVLPGKVLRSISMGHNGLLADIYWTRAVQYFGTQRLKRSENYRLLKPLLDTAVELDPQLVVAYYFGGFFLSTPPPRGAGRPDQAVDLLRRGIAANPDQWRLWHHLGFTYYWELRDFENASQAYLEGSKNPKAHPWMKVMAAAIASKGGNRDISRFLWTEIYATSQDISIRGNAEKHLQALRAADDMDALERLAREFHAREGRWPASLRELIAAGLLRAIPADPHDYPYRISAEGKFELDPKSDIVLDIGPSPAAPAETQPAAQ